MYFALLTGLRHGEICAVEKKNFDAGLKRLKAERFKTRKSGIRWTTFEPLTETQFWVLNEAAKLFPNGQFFFSRQGKIHNKIYSILKENCKKLNTPYGRDVDGGFVPHDAWHTFVKILEHGAVDSSTTRSFSGHSKDSMMKRYSHATLDSRARAMRIIERELGGTSSDPEAALQEFFTSVRAGKLTFKQFKKSLESFSGYFANTQEIDVADVEVVIEEDSDFIQ